MGDRRMNIDLREFDTHEHGPTLEQRLQQPVFDLQLAQKVREKMRSVGLRVPLTDAEEFAEADKRLRGKTL